MGASKMKNVKLLLKISYQNQIMKSNQFYVSQADLT